MGIGHRRIGATGALIATIAATLAAAPVGVAAGSGTTHHVGATPGSGACADPDFPTIADATAAAGPGDTIVVCPGTYREWVRITGTPGLTLRAATPWSATIQPPTLGTAGVRPAGDSQLVAINGADRTTIQGLRIVVPTTGACHGIGYGIVVQHSRRVAIRGNRVLATGSGTYLGSCGLVHGIRVQNHSGGLVGWNLVQDFRSSGITVAGETTRVRVVRNSVRYRHAGSPGGPSGAVGIEMDEGATGVVAGNRLVGLPGAVYEDPSTAGTFGTTPTLHTGIRVEDVAAGVVVRGNLIRHAYDGLRVVADGTIVEDNEIDHVVDVGLRHDGDGGRVRRNRVSRAQTGLFVSGAGTIYRANRLTDTSGYACWDSSSGGASGPPSYGTLNTWIGNVGLGSVVNLAFPAGICTAPTR